MRSNVYALKLALLAVFSPTLTVHIVDYILLSHAFQYEVIEMKDPPQ